MKNGHIKKKIVILRKNEKSGVDPPPSPTTPAPYYHKVDNVYEDLETVC